MKYFGHKKTSCKKQIWLEPSGILSPPLLKKSNVFRIKGIWGTLLEVSWNTGKFSKTMLGSLYLTSTKIIICHSCFYLGG